MLRISDDDVVLAATDLYALLSCQHSEDAALAVGASSAAARARGWHPATFPDPPDVTDTKRRALLEERLDALAADEQDAGTEKLSCRL